jgi:hypothetical protein
MSHLHYRIQRTGELLYKQASKQTNKQMKNKYKQTNKQTNQKGTNDKQTNKQMKNKASKQTADDYYRMMGV